MLNSISRETKRQKALNRIAEYPRLEEIYQLEQEAMERIIKQALNCVDVSEHWHEYDRLKDTMSQFVGFDASHSQLQTTRHYEAMIDFIDWLLVLSRKPVIVEHDRAREDNEEGLA
jgi:hypothetical protein